MSQAIAVEHCGNCGRLIGALETAHVWGQHPVCAGCYEVLTRPVTVAPAAYAAPPPVPQVVYVQGPPAPRWNPGVAAVLSFLIPGLGQIYKGQIVNGLVWLVIVIIGYALFILPGICLHLFCIIGAASGNPHK